MEVGEVEKACLCGGGDVGDVAVEHGGVRGGGGGVVGGHLCRFYD